MNELRCAMSSCVSVFRTEEPLAANARYICSHHELKDVYAAFPEIRKAHTKENGETKKRKDIELSFQHEQFSDVPYLGSSPDHNGRRTISATDPVWYLKNGGSRSSEHGDNSIVGGSASENKKNYIKRAEVALEGHENKEEILEVLREDMRDRVGGGSSR